MATIACLVPAKKINYSEHQLPAGAYYSVDGADKVCVLDLTRQENGGFALEVKTFEGIDRVLPSMFEVTSRPKCSVDEAKDYGFTAGIYDINEEVPIQEYINAFWAEGKKQIDAEIRRHCRTLLNEGCKEINCIIRQDYTILSCPRDEGCDFEAVMYREIGMYGTF
jgi:hypothetical protein